MFQFPRSATRAYTIQHGSTGHDPRQVFPLGDPGVLAWLAARPGFSQLPHVRLRLLAPKHPPCTLLSLTVSSRPRLQSLEYFAASSSIPRSCAPPTPLGAQALETSLPHLSKNSRCPAPPQHPATARALRLHRRALASMQAQTPRRDHSSEKHTRPPRGAPGCLSTVFAGLRI